MGEKKVSGKKNKHMVPGVSSTLIRDTAKALYDAMDFEQRAGQKELLLKMAERMDAIYGSNERRRNDILEGIETDVSIQPRDFFVSEAPVGTGKSYVLLMLAFLSWYFYGKKSVVSTQTKILQNQMFSKDIPKFKRLLAAAAEKTALIDPEAVMRWKYRVVKGRGNYLCLNELDKYKRLTNNCGDIIVKSPDSNSVSVVTNTKLVAVCNSVSEIKKDLDRGEGILFDDDPIYPLVVASRANCMKGKESCPYYPTGCTYSASVNASADLIITNHTLITNFLMLDSSGVAEETEEGRCAEQAFDAGEPEEEKPVERKKIPVMSADNYFFDEAHHLMGYQSGEEARDSVSSEEVLMYLATPLPYSTKKESVSEIMDAREHLWSLYQDLLKGIESDRERWCEAAAEKRGSDFQPSFLKVSVLNGFFKDVYDTLDLLRAKSSEIDGECRNILEQDIAMERTVWNRIADNIKEGNITPSSDGLCAGEEGISWNTYRPRSLEDDIAKAIPSCEFASFISGTILMDGRPDVFAAETGVRNIGSCLKVNSPFAHRNINLWIPKADQMPKFSNLDGGRSHFEALCGFCLKYVPPYVEYNYGGVLILCTSVVRMRLLAEMLTPAVEATGRHVLIQGSMPRGKLVKTFLNNPSSVLIATNSFREGFDAPGDRLTWVILDKLPFSNPSDQAYAARMKILKESGVIKDSHSHGINLMLFDLIQSFGRLERTASDWGTLTILDPRFYWLTQMGADEPGNTFRKSMPYTIEGMIPFSWDRSRIIDKMIKPDAWLELAKKTQAEAEIDGDGLL